MVPAHDGPGYGLAALDAPSRLAGYGGGLLAALSQGGVRACQFHPEYAPGQLEISLPAVGPVEAADLNVFARHTIRAHSARHRWRASFSPVVVPGQISNGGTCMSASGGAAATCWRAGTARTASQRAERRPLAGILAELPAPAGSGAPSAASYLRLQSCHWAGAYACWGQKTGKPGCGSSPA